MNVSVIIPCFNAESHIAQTIRSALQQTLRPAEVLVVDDGSTDASLRIVRGFGPPVRSLEGDHRGAARARNRGAESASGEAIMFLDADDLLGPDALAALVEGLRRNPGGIAMVPWERLQWEDGRWVARPASCAPLHPGQDYLDAWLGGWYHPPCSVLWSRRAYDITGGWDETIPNNPNDDGELMMRAMALGIPIQRVNRGRAYYRRPREGVETLSGKRLSEEGLRARLEVYRKLILLLEANGRLDAHRSALGGALDDVAVESGSRFPGIAREARSLAHDVAGPADRRSADRRRRQLQARFHRYAALVRHPLRAVRRRLASPPEIRAGLDGPDS